VAEHHDMKSPTPWTFGIEEEFFLIDPATRALAETVPRQFLRACRRKLGDRVKEEMQQAQVEAATPVLASSASAREALLELRSEIAGVARDYDMQLLAAGTHPTALWSEQSATDESRYDRLIEDFQIVGRRNLVCGLHVHVAVPEQVDRVALMNRLMPWTPLFLALSTASPFWNGRNTGLMSYRQALYDEWPRSGIPDAFDDEVQYADFVDLLTTCGAIEDGSFLWWAIRPSSKFPTLELRIADSCTRVEDSLALAAAFRCLVRAHVRNPELGAYRTPVTRRVVDENRWRAKRYGTQASFIDEQGRCLVGLPQMLSRLGTIIARDAAALGCEPEIRHLGTIARLGTSADVQLALYRRERECMATREAALSKVVDWLAGATTAVSATGGGTSDTLHLVAAKA
jgi:carboxylate-amine ligase